MYYQYIQINTVTYNQICDKILITYYKVIHPYSINWKRMTIYKSNKFLKVLILMVTLLAGKIRTD